MKKNIRLAIATKLITSLWKYVTKNTAKNTAIIGDSMFNNINGKGLSKLKKVDILNIPGATSDDIVDQADDVVEGKPKSTL